MNARIGYKPTSFSRPSVTPISIRGPQHISKVQNKLKVQRTQAVQQNQLAVSLGEALYDMLADQPDLPKEEVTSWTPYIGGAPTNLATGMSRLGTMTQVITNIGNDDLGESMMRFFSHECRDRNIYLEGVQRSDNPTRDVLVTRTSKGDVNFSGFSKPKGSYADCFIDKDAIPMHVLNNASILATGTLGLAFPKTREAMEFAVDQINNNGLVGDYASPNGHHGIGHVDGVYLNGGEMNPSLINPRNLAQNGHSNGIHTKPKGNAAKRGLQSKVFVDLNWRPVFFDDQVSAKMMIENYLQKADYLKVTADEAKWLTGIDPQEAFCNPKLLFNHFNNLKLILISNGRHGASYAYQYRGKVIQNKRPAFRITPVDTTGAGDSFNSGFMSFLLENYHLNDFNDLQQEDWDKCLQFAIATSALTCLGKGAIAPQPSYVQVMEFLEAQRMLDAVTV